MAETPVWPAEHDAKIREVAGQMGDNVTASVLDKLKDILGHAPKMEQYGDVWSPDTMDRLVEAQEDFDLCVSNINDVWQGSAADEFKVWALKYRNSLNDFKGVVDGMRKALYDCSKSITESYKTAIELVAMIAKQIVGLAGDFIGSWPLPFGIAEAVGDVLGAFIEQAGKIIGAGLSRMQEFRTIMSEIDSKVASLAELVPMGHVVAEKGGWEVRPAS